MKRERLNKQQRHTHTHALQQPNMRFASLRLDCSVFCAYVIRSASSTPDYERWYSTSEFTDGWVSTSCGLPDLQGWKNSSPTISIRDKPQNFFGHADDHRNACSNLVENNLLPRDMPNSEASQKNIFPATLFVDVPGLGDAASPARAGPPRPRRVHTPSCPKQRRVSRSTSKHQAA